MNINRASFIAVLFSVFTCSAVGQDLNNRSLTAVLKNKETKIAIGHRKMDKYDDTPENSLSAIRQAIGKIDMIEVDVRRTADGRFVLSHDGTVDRATNGSGEVSKLKYKDLRKMRLLQGQKLSNERIPSLEEVLKLAKNKIYLYIHLKTTDIGVFKLIDKYKMLDQVLFLPSVKPNDWMFQEIELASKDYPQAMFAPWCSEYASYQALIEKYPKQMVVQVYIRKQHEDNIPEVKKVFDLLQANGKIIILNVLFSKYNNIDKDRDVYRDLDILNPTLLFSDHPLQYKGRF